MKKFVTLLLASFFMFTVLPAGKVYADTVCAETVLDQAWDWATTLGKSGLDKDSILAKNKSERAQKCAEKMAQKAKDGAGKAIDGMQKKLGL